MTAGDTRAAASAVPALLRAFTRRAPSDADLARPFGPTADLARSRWPALAAVRTLIGDTPVVPVPSAGGRGTVWLKHEAANGTGTVKARTAYAMLCAAVERSGRGPLRVVEYSGGSLAIALSEMCAAVGVDLHVVVPAGTAPRLVAQLGGRGTTVSSGVPGLGFLGAMEGAARVAETEDRRLLLQHCSAEAVALHRSSTGREVVEQLTARQVEPVALFASTGTGGTVVGVGQALRERWPACRVVAVFPAEAPFGDIGPPGPAKRMSGTGGLGHGLRQPLLDAWAGPWEPAEVSYHQALEAVRRLRDEYRLAVCTSAGGAWLAASVALDTGRPDRHAVAVVGGRGTAEEWADVDG